MMSADCSREAELLDALTTSQWPDRCDPDLIGHAGECRGCGDLVTAFTAVQAGWTDTRADVRVPASGTVWWRAHLRARQEAARAASRPVAVAQGVAAVAGVLLVVAALVLVTPWLAAALTTSGPGFVSDLPGAIPITSRWIAAAGVVLAVASLAVYLTVAED